MNRTQYHLTFLFKYTIDMFILLLIAVLINIHNTTNDESQILSIILVLLILFVASHFIINKWKLSYVYILVPIAIILLMVFGSYWLTAFLVAGFSVWTLEQLHDNIDNNFNEKLLAVMFVSIILINLFFNTSLIGEHKLLIHGVAIGMFVLYFVGRAVIFIVGSGYKISEQLKTVVLISLSLLGIATIIASVYRYAVFSVQTGFIFLLNGVLQLLTPFFSFLENIELEYPEMAVQEMETTEDGDVAEEMISKSSEINTMPVMAILLILFTAGVIISIIIYFKKRSKLEKQKNKTVAYKTTVSGRKVEDTVKTNNALPKSRVRKLYYSFEKWLADKGFGRYYDETIDEWLSRVNLKEKIDRSMIEQYKKYRYDSIELTDEEFKEFKQMIDKMKETLNSEC